MCQCRNDCERLNKITEVENSVSNQGDESIFHKYKLQWQVELDVTIQYFFSVYILV